jgi:hypothetical protein
LQYGLRDLKCNLTKRLSTVKHCSTFRLSRLLKKGSDIVISSEARNLLPATLQDRRAVLRASKVCPGATIFGRVATGGKLFGPFLPVLAASDGGFVRRPAATVWNVCPWYNLFRKRHKSAGKRESAVREKYRLRCAKNFGKIANCQREGGSREMLPHHQGEINGGQYEEGFRIGFEASRARIRNTFPPVSNTR